MVSITLSVSEELRNAMRKFSDVNWSSLVRKTIIDEVKKRQLKEELLEKLREEKQFIEWSVELGKKAKRGRLQRINENNSR